MADDAEEGRPPSGEHRDPPPTAAPLAIPDLTGGDEPNSPPGSADRSLDGGPPPGTEASSPGPVGDGDRNRYGLLLDRAAERGLLTPFEYEVRLRDLASATSFEEMNRIVTELPAFVAPADQAGPRRSRGASSAGGLGAPPARPTGTAGRSSPWLLLAVLVAVAVVALVFLAVYAHHLGRSQGVAPPIPSVPARLLSGPRP